MSSEPTDIIRVEIAIGDYRRTYAIQHDSPIDPKVIKTTELYEISFGVLHIDNSLGEFRMKPEDVERMKSKALAKLQERAKVDQEAEQQKELKHLEQNRKGRKKRRG